MMIMRNLFFLLFVVTCLSVHAQDDNPDTRSKKDNFSKMREKDLRSDIAAFAMAGIDESTGKMPLKSIPMTDFGNNFMKFQGNDVSVTIKAGLFNPAKHKLGFYEETFLMKIDGKPYYGNYGKVPKTTIESVTVLVGKDTIAIPAIAYSDLHNPSFSYRDASGTERTLNSVYFSPDKRTMYIYMLNKEDKGSYEVTWVIQDKKYLRRVLDFNLLK
jgi:hypothetical protein